MSKKKLIENKKIYTIKGNGLIHHCAIYSLPTAWRSAECAWIKLMKFLVFKLFHCSGFESKVSPADCHSTFRLSWDTSQWIIIIRICCFQQIGAKPRKVYRTRNFNSVLFWIWLIQKSKKFLLHSERLFVSRSLPFSLLKISDHNLLSICFC